MAVEPSARFGEPLLLTGLIDTDPRATRERFGLAVQKSPLAIRKVLNPSPPPEVTPTSPFPMTAVSGIVSVTEPV